MNAYKIFDNVIALECGDNIYCFDKEDIDTALTLGINPFTKEKLEKSTLDKLLNIQDFLYVDSKNTINIDSCVIKKLKDVIPIQKLGQGWVGTVYRVCKEKGCCDYALKISEYSPTYTLKIKSGLEMAQKAGELGIGPKVYKSGQCNMFNNKNIEVKHVYILMDFIDGNLLTDLYPQTSEMIERSLGRYIELLDNNIDQDDLHSDNVIIGSNGLYYIIDYDSATEYYLMEEYDEYEGEIVEAAALRLISSIILKCDDLDAYHTIMDDLILGANKVLEKYDQTINKARVSESIEELSMIF